MSDLFDAAGDAHVPMRLLDFMKETGGSFWARWAGLYIVADQGNRNVLVRAFESDVRRHLGYLEQAAKEGSGRT